MRTTQLFLFLLISVALRGAEPTGTIAGIVVDPSGGSVVGAKVTATNLDTRLTRNTTTATDGGFVFPLLPVGAYSVAIEAAGFRRFEQKGIQVKTDQSANVPVSLQVGATTESVTIEANA